MILDAQGRVLASFKGEGWKDYNMPSNLSSNAMYYVRVKTDQGIAVKAFFRL